MTWAGNGPTRASPMDPDATLLLLLEACRDNDRDALLAALDDLTRWIERGGVLPLDPRWPKWLQITLRATQSLLRRTPNQ